MIQHKSCLLLLFFAGIILTPSKARDIPSEPGTPEAYLAINALASTDKNGQVIKRRLELNWINADPKGHKIVLYTQDPTVTEDAESLVVLDTSYHPDNFFLTDIQLEKPTSAELGYTSKCVFPYWIRMEDKVSGRPVTSSRCLQLEPSWMSDRSEELGNLTLADLSLAETHDAAAYKDYLGPEDDNLVTLAVYAQEESLLQQLQWGVRILDIRVAYYPTLDEKFWLTHGIIKVYPLSEGLNQIKEFLKNSQDIVIFHVGGFGQVWDDKAHKDLKAALQKALGTWWVKPLDLSWDTTLDEIWNRQGLPANQGRIIFTYGDEAHFDGALFFEDRPYTWGNVNDPNNLRTYLDNVVASAFEQDYKLWIAGCQMTPTADDIIFGKWKGLRDMADRVNRNVTSWWQTIYGSMMRVGTSHDFILSTDAIYIGIQKSLNVAQQKKKLWGRKTSHLIGDHSNPHLSNRKD